MRALANALARAAPAPRLSLHRHARRRQDDARAHHRQGAQLRDRRDRRRRAASARACTEIDAGRFVDLIELDAASNTQVDNMRELLENALYAPTAGRYKVYIIDEVHMLSRNAFNAMLKTLEEPPEHVKFVLATTDPQKVPVTVLSRCLQFNLKQIPPPQIRGAARSTCSTPRGIALRGGGARADRARGAGQPARRAVAARPGDRARRRQRRGGIGARDAGRGRTRTYLHAILRALAARRRRGAHRRGRPHGRAQPLVRDGAAGAGDAAAPDRARADRCPQALARGRSRPRGAARARRAASAPRTCSSTTRSRCRARSDIGLAPDEYAGFTMTLLRMLAFAPAARRRAAARPRQPARPRRRQSRAASRAGAAAASQKKTPTMTSAGPSCVEQLELTGMARHAGRSTASSWRARRRASS